ncbi:MAG: RagB/SusD family nutrient uptake outer membrane protein [Chitinophagales bacterium]
MFKKSLDWFCVLMITSVFLLSSCGNDNDSIITTVDTITDAESADVYLQAVYTSMVTRTMFSDAYLFMPLLYSDQAKYTGSQNVSWKEASNFDITPGNSLLRTMFTDLYTINNSITFFLNNVDTTTDVTLTDDVKAGLLGEARAVRGVLYFYLTNFWGEVPILNNEDNSQIDSLVTNATAQELFEQMEADLKFGAENISKNSLNGGGTRINEYTAKAFLARLYLYYGDYENALLYAEDVINGSGASLEPFIDNIYTINSSENIWYLTESSDDESIAVWFLQTFAGGQNVVKPRTVDYFEAEDARKEVALSEPGTTVLKYKDVSFDSDPLYLVRISELYLIAAEAAARKASPDFTKASNYLNELRDRAGLEDITLNADNTIDAILKERSAELCFEGPHRWFDLKRLNKDVEVLETLGYTATDEFWPFPTFFMTTFPSLNQNDGY